jgi:alpha-galactosidase
MIKVAFIGAGSVVFSKNLTGDILSYPEFRNATLSYMDIDAERLEVGAALCAKMARACGASPKIEATTDRRKALAGADFVINMVQIGGFDSTLVDFEIPRKYGLNFTIADTTGPGGLFRALRTYPMLRGMCADMMEVCPRAVLLNYSNPMSMNMQTITRTSCVKAVGLCHSVQGTLNQIMGYIGVNPDEVDFVCAGINHMAFYQRLLKDGQDLYPRLFEAMSRPEVYTSNKVRFELMKRLGYFVTESSEHNAEYSAHFIPRGKGHYARYDVPIDEYLRRCDGIVDEFERMKKLARSDSPMEVHKSHEYGSTIIHSIATGKPSVVYGNMPNRGAITNLPDDAIAEVPTLVDRAGLQFTTVGPLPPQLVGYMQPHVTQHELFIRAAMEGRRDHVYQAAMFDPLTAATLTLDQIVEMCDELIAGHGFEGKGGFLPGLDAKRTLVSGSGREFHPPTPKQLRESWDAAQRDSEDEFIKEFRVLGPFKLGSREKASLGATTAFEAEFLKRGDGTVDLKSIYKDGAAELKWVSATSGKRGHVSLDDACGRHDFALAYAYTEIESVHPREVVLGIGSDDAVVVWLNGKEVHRLDAHRGYSPNNDGVSVYLKAGLNRLVLKVLNYTAGWGFGVSVPRPTH